MKTIYFLLLVTLMATTVGCVPNGQSSSSSENSVPKVVFFGDDTVNVENGFRSIIVNDLKMGFVNYAKTYDGSNGAMLGGHQDLSPTADIKPGDKVVYMAGIYDSKWYGAQDPDDQAKNYCKKFVGKIVAKGATVFLATVPRLASGGYTTPAPLNNGSDAASDFYSDVIRSCAASVGGQVHVIDINQLLPAHPDYFNASGAVLNITGHEFVASKFLNDMR